MNEAKPNGIVAAAVVRIEREPTFRPAGERPASLRFQSTVLDDHQAPDRPAQWIEAWLLGPAAERYSERLAVGSVVRLAGRLEHRRDAIGARDRCAVVLRASECSLVTPAKE